MATSQFSSWPNDQPIVTSSRQANSRNAYLCDGSVPRFFLLHQNTVGRTKTGLTFRRVKQKESVVRDVWKLFWKFLERSTTCCNVTSKFDRIIIRPRWTRLKISGILAWTQNKSSCVAIWSTTITHSWMSLVQRSFSITEPGIPGSMIHC